MLRPKLALRGSGCGTTVELTTLGFAVANGNAVVTLSIHPRRASRPRPLQMTSSSSKTVSAWELRRERPGIGTRNFRLQVLRGLRFHGRSSRCEVAGPSAPGPPRLRSWFSSITLEQTIQGHFYPQNPRAISRS